MAEQQPPEPAPDPQTPARAILRKGDKITVNGQEFTLEMNAVISGTRATITAAGIEIAR